MNFEFQLFWPVDIDGYKIDRRHPGPNTEFLVSSLNSDHGERSYIVRKRGSLEFRNVFAFGSMLRELAENEPTDAGALSFVNNFGFLGKMLADEEPADQIINAINFAKSLVDAIDSDNLELVARLVRINEPALRLPISFEKTEDGGAKFWFKPENLWQAIIVQALGDVTTGTAHRKCAGPGCTTWFDYGAGTGKRKSREYCSNRCRSAAYYRRNKTGSK